MNATNPLRSNLLRFLVRFGKVCGTLLSFAIFMAVVFLIGTGVYYAIVGSYSVWYSIVIIVAATAIIGYIVGEDAQKIEQSHKTIEKWFPEMGESVRNTHLERLVEDHTEEIYGTLLWWVFIFLVNFFHIVRMVWF